MTKSATTVASPVILQEIAEQGKSKAFFLNSNTESDLATEVEEVADEAEVDQVIVIEEEDHQDQRVILDQEVEAIEIPEEDQDQEVSQEEIEEEVKVVIETEMAVLERIEEQAPVVHQRGM